MARKRASLKDKGEEILKVKRGGQGADILFGADTEAEPEAVSEDKSTPARSPKRKQAKAGAAPAGEAEALKGEAILAATAEHPAGEEGLPQGEADLDEELDLDSLLSAEARAAEGETALPDLATTPAAPAPPVWEPATPPPPPPVVERPLPAPPPYTPPPPPQSSAASMPPLVDSPAPSPTPAVAPPSTTTGAPDLSVPRPPRQIQMASSDFDLLAEDLSADAVAAALLGAPEGVKLTAEQRAQLLRRRPVLEKLAELDTEIDGQYDRILQGNVSVNKGITDWCHNLLAEARTIVTNREVGKLAKAEWNVEQVRARLDRADESRKQANRYAWPITIWGVAWFAIFVFLIFNPTFILQFLTTGEVGDSFLIPQIFLRSLFFGGIGGVAAVFYHLFKYMQERTFDSQYALSYVAKPFMGMILGSMIYLTVFVLMRALNIAPSGFGQGSAETVTDVMYMAILFFVAMAAGFKENLAFDLLNRVIKAVLGSEKGEEQGSPAPPPSTTTTNP